MRSHRSTTLFQISVDINIHFEDIFGNLRFARFCAEYCGRFHKNGGLDLRFCTKTEQCERGISSKQCIVGLSTIPNKVS